MGGLVVAGLALSACGGDDSSGAPPAAEGPAVAGADEVAAVWTELDEAYETSRDPDDPFSPEAQEAFLAVISSGIDLLPDPLPVPAEPDPSFGYGMQRDDACVADLRLSVDLVDPAGEGIGGGADADGVRALFEEAFADSWEIDFDEAGTIRYLYDHEGTTWQLDVFDAFMGDHSALDFCPLAP